MARHAKRGPGGRFVAADPPPPVVPVGGWDALELVVIVTLLVVLVTGVIRLRGVCW